MVDNPAPPPLVPVQPHDPPSAPAAPPQPQPLNGTTRCSHFVHWRGHRLAPGGGKGKNMAPKTPAATAAGKNTGRDKSASKTKPAVGKSKSGPSHEKADQNGAGRREKTLRLRCRSASRKANNQPTSAVGHTHVRPRRPSQLGRQHPIKRPPSSNPAEPAHVHNMADG